MLERKSDPRGWLIEIFKEEVGNGQVYMFTMVPDAVRGNHYHKRKEEYFVLVQGIVELVLEDVRTQEKETLLLNANEEVKKVYVAPWVNHTFTNKSEQEAFIIAHISEQFNPEDPDTYYPK